MTPAAPTAQTAPVQPLDTAEARQQPEHGTGVGSEASEGARRWWPAIVCLGLYAVVAALEFGHFEEVGATVMAGPRAEDQIAQVWWLAWGQYALAHGHNPFFTDWQNFPVGYNFGVNGSMLALGVLFSPITTVFGPVVTWNVLLRLAPVVSAFSMCLVLRRWARWWPAAFIGGLLYGFSAYMTFYAERVPLPHLRADSTAHLFAPARDRGAPDLGPDDVPGCSSASPVASST